QRQPELLCNKWRCDCHECDQNSLCGHVGAEPVVQFHQASVEAVSAQRFVHRVCKVDMRRPVDRREEAESPYKDQLCCDRGRAKCHRPATHGPAPSLVGPMLLNMSLHANTSVLTPLGAVGLVPI